MALVILENWLVNVWLGTTLIAMVVALWVALRTLGFFEDDTNESAQEKASRAKDPWHLVKLVESFSTATHKEWEQKDKDGTLLNPVKTEMDREDALRLILEHRRRVVSLLIAFAALMAVLTTVAVVLLNSPKGQVSENPPTATNGMATTTQ